MGQELGGLVFRGVRVLKVPLLPFWYSHLEITPLPTRASLGSSVGKMEANVVHLVTRSKDTRLRGLAMQFKVHLTCDAPVSAFPVLRLQPCATIAEQLRTEKGTH